MDEMLLWIPTSKADCLNGLNVKKETLEFKVIDEVGSGISSNMVVELLIDQVIFGRGQDYSIKAAEQQPLRKHWRKSLFKNNNHFPDI